MSHPCHQRAVHLHPLRWFHVMLLLVVGAGLMWTSIAAAEQASSHARPFQAGYLDAGGEHTCAVLLDGSLRCWGTNRGSRLGIPGVGAVPDPGAAGPVLVREGRTEALANGLFHTCAIVGAGVVKCWGFAANGRLGTGAALPGGATSVVSAADAAPVDLGPGRRARAIAAGLSHTCAILDTGEVRCWGTGSFGRLGNGDTQDVGDDEVPGARPVVDLPRAARAITAGDYHTCAILDDGSVRCWGYDANGRLGAGLPLFDTVTRPTPALNLGPGRTAVAISAGSAHTCAVLDNGAVTCWGFNGNGQLGQGSTTSRPVPTPPVDLGGRATAIAAAPGYIRDPSEAYVGGAHTCAVLESGAVRCWGFNGNARLGSSDWGQQVGATNLPTDVPPVDLGPGARARAITLGNAHSCVLLADDSVRCWGFNDDGRLGNGQTGNTVGDNETPGVAPAAALGGPAPGSVALVDLGVSPGTSAVTVGAETTMRVRVTNTQGDPAAVRVTLQPSGGLAVSSGAPDRGAYDAGRRIWDTGSLSPGQSAALEVRVRGTAPGAASLAGTLSATARDPRVGAAAVAAIPVEVNAAPAPPPPPPPPPPAPTVATPPTPPPVAKVRATRLTAAVTRLPKRGLITRMRVTGRLVLPRSAARNACAGRVRITVLAGKRKVVTRTVRVRGRVARCTYTTTFAVPRRHVRSAKRLRVQTRFLGTARVRARVAPNRNVAVRVAPSKRSARR